MVLLEHTMLWLQQPEASDNSAELGVGFSPAEVSMCVFSDTGLVALCFSEPASLQNTAARIIGPLGPDLGLKRNSMGRNGKDGVASD